MPEPEKPSATNPGAHFTEGLYLRIAQLSNRNFIALRDEIIAPVSGGDSADLQALQTSFYTNGCTGAPSWLTPGPTWEACVQHDFRYTVGPNIFFNDAEKARADRAAADRQLGENIGAGDDVLAKLVGLAAENVTGTVGWWFYATTPIRDAKLYASGYDIYKTLQEHGASSRAREVLDGLV
ncbi:MULTISPECIES: hypothetical protein [unclassified Streptomyces]|uniref:Uncharacterized protein n=1 Tax=Streptomyces sp. NBC_00060 TaxID=2975636 RepID=A0AAU2GT23_9ACTN